MRVSLRSVAAAAGVNVATASRALRGLGIVAPETRARVEEAARRLGYTRDPVLARTLAYVRRPEKPVYRETLAFLSDEPVPAHRHINAHWLYDIHQGARARADKLGCSLETFLLERGRRAQLRLGRILRARGIRGVIVAPVTHWQPAVLHLDVERLAIVQVSNTIWRPLIHRVESDFYTDLISALLRLKRRGYRRIGLAMDRRYERIRRWMPLAALLLLREFTGGLSPVTPLERRWSWSREGFRAWLASEKPDVIVTNGESVAHWLHELGLRVPEDISLMRLDADSQRSCGGLVPDHHACSEAAVDMVMSLVETGDFGVPRTLRNLQIGHSWHEGTTLRPSAATVSLPGVPIGMSSPPA